MRARSSLGPFEIAADWVGFLTRFGFGAGLGRSALRDGEGAEDPAEGAHQDHQFHPYLPHEPAREGMCVNLALLFLLFSWTKEL